mgnify:CR=1 FL=1
MLIHSLYNIHGVLISIIIYHKDEFIVSNFDDYPIKLQLMTIPTGKIFKLKLMENDNNEY